MRFSWIDLAIIVAGGWLFWRVFRTYAGVERLSPEEVRNLFENRNQNQLCVVDVRTPAEFQQWHIPGAKSIPIQELQYDPEKATAELDHEVTTVVVCETGSRSVPAFHTLKRLGFKAVYNMHGGMISWRGPSARGPG